jgi:hypothetical protein
MGDRGTARKRDRWSGDNEGERRREGQRDRGTEGQREKGRKGEGKR